MITPVLMYNEVIKDEVKCMARELCAKCYRTYNVCNGVCMRLHFTCRYCSDKSIIIAVSIDESRKATFGMQ